ncbi:CoA transferase [Comamonas endophytica]|uniref:CoA transferase n=1 Tax=Comamonas endophytica TaxID=2949090 RepID=A0ABY6G9G9_9BURK|nr:MULTISPECIES: CoA transferase [unclassified Acidovorax]MCD2511810.1 CoA transferase [Acidovorax sp. D4N7]UYG51533.1 CoA transferase [Acidovorax sp. 5MLIR]
MHTTSSWSALPLQPLRGTRILSLALNLPGPAALLRCAAMGAKCTKLEPLPAPGNGCGDPMHAYCAPAYEHLHAGVECLQIDLKTPQGQDQLHAELARADVLMTSFRPTALRKLGLEWETLQARHPQLSMVRIFGMTGVGADTPGHDITYQAEAGLLPTGQMPASLLADMTGALMASEAVLQTQMHRLRCGAGALLDIGLFEAAQWLAQPLHWGLSAPGGVVGGAHAGYRTYRCRDGMVAVAALEPHFAARLCAAAGLSSPGDVATMQDPATHEAIASFVQQRSMAQLQEIALQQDIPLHAIHAAVA